MIPQYFSSDILETRYFNVKERKRNRKGGRGSKIWHCGRTNVIGLHKRSALLLFAILIGVYWKISVIKDINYNWNYTTLTNCECSFQWCFVTMTTNKHDITWFLKRWWSFIFVNDVILWRKNGKKFAFLKTEMF